LKVETDDENNKLLNIYKFIIDNS